MNTSSFINVWCVHGGGQFSENSGYLCPKQGLNSRVKICGDSSRSAGVIAIKLLLSFRLALNQAVRGTRMHRLRGRLSVA